MLRGRVKVPAGMVMQTSSSPMMMVVCTSWMKSRGRVIRPGEQRQQWVELCVSTQSSQSFLSDLGMSRYSGHWTVRGVLWTTHLADHAMIM